MSWCASCAMNDRKSRCSSSPASLIWTNWTRAPPSSKSHSHFLNWAGAYMMFWHKAGKQKPPCARKSASAHDLYLDGELIVAAPGPRAEMTRRNQYRPLIVMGLWLSMIAIVPALTQATNEEQGFSKGFIS